VRFLSPLPAGERAPGGRERGTAAILNSVVNVRRLIGDSSKGNYATFAARPRFLGKVTSPVPMETVASNSP